MQLTYFIIMFFRCFPQGVDLPSEVVVLVNQIIVGLATH